MSISRAKGLVWSFAKTGHTFPKLQRADTHRHAPKQHGQVKELFILLKSGKWALHWENIREGIERKKLVKDLTHNFKDVANSYDSFL